LQRPSTNCKFRRRITLAKQSRLESAGPRIGGGQSGGRAKRFASLTNTLAEEIKHRKEAEHLAEQMTDTLTEESRHRKLAEQQAGELGPTPR